MSALARRREVVKALGEVKAYALLPAVDPDREEVMRARRIAHATELGLPMELVEKLYEVILAESRLLVTAYAKAPDQEE